MNQDYLACWFQGSSREGLQQMLIERLAGRGCHPRSAGSDLHLFASADLPVRSLSGRRGWALGHVFDGQGLAAPPELTAGAGLATAHWMVQQAWGSYVMLAHADGEFQAWRDPSGGLSCYHAEIDGVHYFTSLPHLLVDCGLIDTKLDWTEIVRSLTEHSDRAPATCIRGLDELLPGTHLTIANGEARRRQLWDPWIHANASPPEDPAEALRSALCSTLQAWGRSLRRPLIEISGGLDSAIVAAGLSKAATEASLITFASASGDPDETLYAQVIADHLGLPLEIARPRIGDVDLTRSLSADLPRPNARAFTQAADAQSLQHGRAIGADAFVSGGGGDDVFCYLRTALPAVDRFRIEGVSGMVSAAMDIARMTHATFWEALCRSLRRLIRRRPSRGRRDLRFIAADAVDRNGGFEPSGEHRFPGKAAHVRSIMTIHNYLEGHARAHHAPILSPLLSQPIVECCLSIPTWRWCEGGQNRAVARRAFQSLLPSIVLERRSKGRFDGFCAALLEANRDLVRSMLIEGVLAQQGLLDRRAIATALNDPFPSAETVARLLELMDVESWTGSWTSRVPYRS